MFTEQLHRQLAKEPRRVCARRRKESPIIFFGDMCGEENTSRPANVRAVRLLWAARALQSGRKPLCQKRNTFLTVSRGGKPPRIKMGLSFISREAQIKDSPLFRHQNKGLSCGVRFHHLRTSFSFLAAHGYWAPHTDSDRCEGKCSFKISHHCVPSPELQNPVCFRSIQYIGLTSKASTEPLL